MFRYQDDMIVFNDDHKFEEHWREIYPEEMVLEKTNNGNSSTFLDLATAIINHRFYYKSYDKRNDFNFNIIKYPDLDSNIPRNASYGVFISQLVRYCDVNNQIDNYFNDIQTLAQLLVTQHFDPLVLTAKFRKYYSNNMRRWCKFGDIQEAVHLI